MNNENPLPAEQMSALMDGELGFDEFADVVDSVTGTREGMITWQAYHMVGDVLRGTPNPMALDAGDFLLRLRSRMDSEGARVPATLSKPLGSFLDPAPARGDSANDPVVRWKLLAGFASLAAVVMLGWHVASLDVESGRLAQLKSSSQAQVLAAGVAQTEQQQAKLAGPAPAVMLRDPRLDELLAAHKQFGGTSALQMPAGFLRNAAFDGSNR